MPPPEDPRGCAPDLQAQVQAIRSGVALAELSHYAVLRLPGAGALAALDRICAAPPVARVGRMQQALFLHPDARPLSDVYVCRDEDEVLLLCEGLDGPALAAHVQAVTGHPTEDLGEAAELIGICGPYAWELLGRLVGPEVYGLPPRAAFQYEGWRGFLASKTGEHGVLLLVPRARAAALRTRLWEAGAGLALVPVGLAALDQCALEGWHFNIRREGQTPGVTPIELQLQARVSTRPGRDYPGAEALRQRRAGGVRRRLTALAGPGPMAVGAAVAHEGAVIGQVLNAGACAARGEWVAAALLERPWAVPGIDGLEVRPGGGPARTVSAPLVLARSLFVVPGQHRFADRDRTPVLPGLPLG